MKNLIIILVTVLISLSGSAQYRSYYYPKYYGYNHYYPTYRTNSNHSIKNDTTVTYRFSVNYSKINNESRISQIKTNNIEFKAVVIGENNGFEIGSSVGYSSNEIDNDYEIMNQYNISFGYVRRINKLTLSVGLKFGFNNYTYDSHEVILIDYGYNIYDTYILETGYSQRNTTQSIYLSATYMMNDHIGLYTSIDLNNKIDYSIGIIIEI